MKKSFDIFSKVKGRSITSMYNTFREIFDLIVEEHKKWGMSSIRFYIKGFVYYNQDKSRILKEFPVDSGSGIIMFEDIYDDKFRLAYNENMAVYGADFTSDKVVFDMIFDSIFNRYGLNGIHSVMLDTDYIMNKEQGLEYYDGHIEDVFEKIEGNGDIDECLGILVSSFNDIVKEGFIYRFGHVVEKNGDDRLDIRLVSADYEDRIYDVLFEDGGNRVLRIK